MNKLLPSVAFKEKVSSFLNQPKQADHLFTFFQRACEVKVTQSATAARIFQQISSWIDEDPQFLKKDLAKKLERPSSGDLFSLDLRRFSYEFRKKLIAWNEISIPNVSLQDLAEHYRIVREEGDIPEDSLFKLIAKEGDAWESKAAEGQKEVTDLLHAKYDASIASALILIGIAYCFRNLGWIEYSVFSFILIYLVNERYFAFI